jgi:hypothetical protein
LWSCPATRPAEPVANTATPMNWTFTRHDVNVLLDRLDQRGRLATAA